MASIDVFTIYKAFSRMYHLQLDCNVYLNPKASFGTWKVLRKENSEEKWKEREFGGKYKISLNLIN